jgi:pimeloyl-ACP methyl ester carboxylesterase
MKSEMSPSRTLSDVSSQDAAARRVVRRPLARRLGVAAMLLGLSAAGLPAAAEPESAAGVDMRPNAVAFRQMRYGIFITQTHGLTAWPDGRGNATLDEFADAFDVKAFADQMERIGVEYVIFTAWHKAIYNLGPNTALDQWLPGHTSRRDLIGEIADALHARDIKLVIYAHPNDFHDLTREEQERLGYRVAGADQNPKVNNFINEVFVDLCARYRGKSNVLGFWWDTWGGNGGCVDMPRLVRTTREHFPGAITLSQDYDPKYIDFLSIEAGGPRPLDAMSPEKDGQTFFVMHDWWNAHPDARLNLKPEDMYRFILLNAGTGAPGGISWAISPLADGRTWGADNQPLQVLEALGRLIAPVRPTICNVLPSRNWVLPSGTRWPDAPAFVAARSPDHKKEYIHVLKPPAGRFIDLPKPAEAFTAARMYLSKKPVAMAMEGEALRLTLPEGENWNELDTVIELTVADTAPAWPDGSMDTWRGYVRHHFVVDGCRAWVVEPKKALPGRPWTWCMEFPDAFTERTGVPQLLEKGFHHLHIEVGNTFGSPAALKHFDAFHKVITAAGLAPRGTLIGISRGGLYAYNWAALNPDKVVCIYGDAPVCDFKSWPGGKGRGQGSPGDWQALIRCYGFKDEAEALAWPNNPVDRLEPLARAGIPLIHVVGDADDAVPVAENTAVIEERYKAMGGTITVFHKPGGGHHPHGLDDPGPVADLIMRYTEKAQPAP